MKLKYEIVFYIVLATFSVTGFQNCSDVEFENLPSNPTLSGNPDGPPDLVDPVGDPDVPTQAIELPLFGEYASIAFEDNVQSPNAGDRDYNDAVFNYRISEQYNSLNQLLRIEVEVRVREKISGNNHRLFLYLNGDPSGDFSNISHVSSKAVNGLVDVSVEDPMGEVEVIEGVDHLMIVPGTSGAVGDVYKLSIEIQDPGANKVASVPDFIDFRKYRFILQNHGDTRGIDISEINSTDEMVAADGYPLGFMIPTDWQPPAETQLIDNAYVNFGLYRAWLNGDQSSPPSEEALTWFM